MKRDRESAAEEILSRLMPICEEETPTVKKEYVICGNCGTETAEFLHVPEFDYIGCIPCYEGAMAQLRREELERLRLGPAVSLTSQHRVTELAVTAAIDCGLYDRTGLSQEERDWMIRAEFSAKGAA